MPYDQFIATQRKDLVPRASCSSSSSSRPVHHHAPVYLFTFKRISHLFVARNFPTATQTTTTTAIYFLGLTVVQYRDECILHVVYARMRQVTNPRTAHIPGISAICNDAGSRGRIQIMKRRNCKSTLSPTSSRLRMLNNISRLVEVQPGEVPYLVKQQYERLAVKMAKMTPSFRRRKRAHWIALFVTSASSFHLAPVWIPSAAVRVAVDNSLRMSSSGGNMNRAHFVRSCAAATVGGAAALTLAPRSSSATTASHVVRALGCELGL